LYNDLKTEKEVLMSSEKRSFQERNNLLKEKEQIQGVLDKVQAILQTKEMSEKENQEIQNKKIQQLMEDYSKLKIQLNEEREFQKTTVESKNFQIDQGKLKIEKLEKELFEKKRRNFENEIDN